MIEIVNSAPARIVDKLIQSTEIVVKPGWLSGNVGKLINGLAEVEVRLIRVTAIVVKLTIARQAVPV